MFPRCSFPAALFLACWVVSANAQAAPHGQAEMVVSPELAKSFDFHDNAVLLPDGTEITVLRHFDVKLRRVAGTKEERDAGPLPPFLLQITLLRDTRGQNRFNLGAERHLSSVLVRACLPREDGAAPDCFEKLLTGMATSGPEASRLDALKQLDTTRHNQIGRSLVSSVRVTKRKTQLRIVLRNPYQIPVAGLCYMRTEGGKPRDRDLGFRLAPGEEQVRLVPLADPHEPVNPKDAFASRETIDAFFDFPRLALNAPPER